MKKILLSALAAGLCSIALLHAQVKTEWTHSYSDTFSHINFVSGRQQQLIDKNGNMYIAGESDMDSASNGFGLLLKYAPNGNLQWQKRLTPPVNLLIAQSAQGCSIVSADDSGRIYVYGHNDVFAGPRQTSLAGETFVCNDSGRLLDWEEDWFGIENYQYISKKGQIFHIRSLERNIAITRGYFAAPDYEEANISDSMANNKVLGGLTDKDGNTYVYAYTYYNDPDSLTSNILLAKADTGINLKWFREYNASPGSNTATYPTGMVTDDSNNVYVSGYSTDMNGNSKGLFLKYSAAGNLVFAKTVLKDSFLANIQMSDIRIDSKGMLLLTGYIATGNYREQVLLKYHPDGTVIWSRYLDKGQGYNLNPAMLAIDASDNAFVLSYLDDFTTTDNYVTKYNTFGQKLWEQKIDIEKLEIPQQISVANNGDVYISGNAVVSDTLLNIISARLSQTLKSGFTYTQDCSGKVNFSDASNAPSGTMTYAWDFGDGNTSTSQNPVHNYTAGKYAVKLTVKSGSNTDTYTGSVTIAPLPEACFAVQNTGRKHVLTANDTSLADYTWIVNGTDTLKGKMVLYTTARSGDNFTVMLIVTSSAGCQNTCTKTINTGIEEYLLPSSVALYPNPLTGASVLRFNLRRQAAVSVRVTDALGRTALLINDAHYPAGEFNLLVKNTFAPGIITFTIILDGRETMSIKAMAQ